MEKQVTQKEFKKLYFRYATLNSGWTEHYWNQFFENEEGKTYFFSEPETPQASRMFIISDEHTRRMIFLTEDAEDSFFDFPGKE